MRLDWILGFPDEHGPARVVFRRPAATFHLPLPLWLARARSRAHRYFRAGPPRGEVSLAPVPRRWHPRPLPAEPTAPGCLRKPPSWVPTGDGVCTGLSQASYSPSGGRASPHVIATADGALLFQDVPCAVRFRASGRLKKKKNRRRKTSQRRFRQPVIG